MANKHLEVSICEEKVIKNEDIEKVALLEVSFTFLFNDFFITSGGDRFGQAKLSFTSHKTFHTIQKITRKLTSNKYIEE